MRKSISFSTHIKEDALWHINETKYHQSKISNASISIDDEPPHIYKHVMLNHKKMHQTEAYYKTIEQGNQRLLKRIQKILHRNTVDTDMNTKSLNHLIRKKQLIRITNENKEINDKIKTQKPYYSHVDWTKEEYDRKKLLMSMKDKKCDDTNYNTNYRSRIFTMRIHRSVSKIYIPNIMQGNVDTLSTVRLPSIFEHQSIVDKRTNNPGGLRSMKRHLLEYDSIS